MQFGQHGLAFVRLHILQVFKPLVVKAQAVSVASPTIPPEVKRNACDSNIPLILDTPCLVIATCEFGRIINFHGNDDPTAGAGVVLQSRKVLAAAGKDEHDGPIGGAEHASKTLLVHAAGLRAIARMRVRPYPTELFRSAAEIYLAVEEIGNAFIIEHDGYGTHILLNCDKVRNKQQIIAATNAESANLAIPSVAKELELRPRTRREAKHRLQLGIAMPPRLERARRLRRRAF